MTEKEKMIACRIYAPEDPECARDRTRAHDLCRELNATRPSDIAARRGILARLLPNAKTPPDIASPFQCQFGANIAIGANFRAAPGLMLIDNTTITIGDNVTAGPGCIITTPVHPMSPEKRNTYKIYCLPIVIGDNVHIGAEVKILAGVTIGSNVTIADGTVVHKDIPSNCSASGNPFRAVPCVQD